MNKSERNIIGHRLTDKKPIIIMEKPGEELFGCQ
jgi:hypothetical protein